MMMQLLISCTPTNAQAPAAGAAEKKGRKRGRYSIQDTDDLMTRFAGLYAPTHTHTLSHARKFVTLYTRLYEVKDTDDLIIVITTDVLTDSSAGVYTHTHTHTHACTTLYMHLYASILY